MTDAINNEGHGKLWGWFGLSRASFLTLPRVLMHEMPDEWQGKMADLLEQYDATYTNQPDIDTSVRATKNGKLTKFPSWMLNYRHPDYEAIEELRKPYGFNDINLTVDNPLNLV